MQYRPFGKTGFEVSLLGMGCMRLPRTTDSEGNARIDKEKAIELIQYAADNGINYFDTALTYHSSQSEALLGEALAGGRRQKVRIATKQPFSFMKDTDTIKRNLEATLKKLQTDYLDVYLVHNIRDDNWEGVQKLKVFDTYQKLKEEGLIGAVAFSYHGGYHPFKEILDTYDWDMCQIQQNLLDIDKHTTEQSIFDAGNKGLALVIMEPLRGGGLANAPGDVKKLYAEFPVKRAPVEWAFRHVYNYPQVSTILSGMTTMEQLKENLAIFAKDDVGANVMSIDEKKLLLDVKAAYESRVTIDCTECEYCMPCPQNVNIPNIFRIYNDAMRFETLDQQQRSYLFARNSKSDASNCIECALCEEKCPQSIEIIKELKKAHELLDGWYE